MKTIRFIICGFSLLLTNAAFCITTFTVTNTADAGAGSLRQAILNANATLNAGGNDIISFSGIGAGVQTIALTTDLPSPTEPVTIDGYTAPSYAANAPVVQLNGNNWGILFNNAGATGSIVRGLIFWGANTGVEANGVNNITIEGCWFGINNTGTVPAVPDHLTNCGIILNNSDNCLIGGTTAASRNVISGCDQEGIYLLGGSDNTSIYGNYIGVGINGNTDLGNGVRGIRVEASVNNRIGNGANTRNIISGNGEHGILLLNSSGNLVASNYIGLGADGTTALANGFHGVTVNNSPATTIGGTTISMRNVISNNGFTGYGQGIAFENGSSNSFVLGNFIGLSADGLLARPNLIHGVHIENSPDLLIQGNIISANAFSGINNVANSHRTVIKTNIIGLNLANAAMGNLQHGIYLDGSNDCVIGGTAYTDRNVISSNGDGGGENGISILNCNNHIIKGNFCGTDITGTLARPNRDTGLSLTNSTGNIIGGATHAERNVFSANPNFGIFMDNVHTTMVQGNYIGTDSTGNVGLGNLSHGVQIQNGCNAITWQSNVVSANGDIGLNFLTNTNNLIYGNIVGLGVDGITDLGNTSIGIRLAYASYGNTIGGTGANQRNIVSGNGDHGIFLESDASGNTIRSNYIGSDITGLLPVPNAKIGIFLMHDCLNNNIGGNGAGEGNLSCCAANGDGIRLQVSSGNTVYGNLIGTDKNGAYSAGFGNAQHGIYIISYNYLTASASNNLIGGLGAGQANIITQNGGDGVRISGTPDALGSNSNPIIGNKIYCNGGQGINMENDNAFENQGEPAPGPIGGLTRTANLVSGTGIAGHTIHIYRNQFNDGTAKCDCEGEIYIGTTTVNGSGNWSYTHNLGLNPSQYNAVTATQTNGTNSTSEFASCAIPAPVTLLSFTGVVNEERNAQLQWLVASELNFSHYIVMKSYDAVTYEALELVPPAGSGSSYAVTDAEFEGSAYYKLAMVDLDGKVKYSNILRLNQEGNTLQLVPNPARDQVAVAGFTMGQSLKVLNAVGAVLYEGDQNIFSVAQYTPGVYIVQITENNTVSNLKLVVE